MIIQFVRLNVGLSDEETRRVMEERAPQFREQPGLLQKFYGREVDGGAYCGMYIWDSEESLTAFRQTELARTIPGAYQVEEPPRVEFYEVLFPLRPEAGALAG
jgi:heme-degrading monooxygenase HmoA